MCHQLCTTLMFGIHIHLLLVIISLRPILFVVDETIEMDEFQTKAAEDGERAVTAVTTGGIVNRNWDFIRLKSSDDQNVSKDVKMSCWKNGRSWEDYVGSS